MRKLSLDQIISQSLESFKNCPDHDNCKDCDKNICVNIVAVADFPTKFGIFQIIGFVNNKDEKEHIVVVKGDIIGTEESILTRIHSSCLTGDALGSLRCDCGSQLGAALSMIEEEGLGMIVYMAQEGRGIGLLNKLRAYALQDNGFDTYDANIALGFDADQRDYEIAGEMLRKLGVQNIRLITNNPEKINQLKEYITITERVPLELKPSKHSLNYMKTKKDRFGHFLSLFNPFQER